MSFAGSGKDSRTTHILVSLDPNYMTLAHPEHERPFGRIDDARQQEMIARFFHGYGDITSLQGDLARHGNMAAAHYPLLDRIKRCIAPPANSHAIHPSRTPTRTYPHTVTTLWLHIPHIGQMPIQLDPDAMTPATATRLYLLAAANTSGRVHRAEPLPRCAWLQQAPLCSRAGDFWHMCEKTSFVGDGTHMSVCGMNQSYV